MGVETPPLFYQYLLNSCAYRHVILGPLGTSILHMVAKKISCFDTSAKMTEWRHWLPFLVTKKNVCEKRYHACSFEVAMPLEKRRIIKRPIKNLALVKKIHSQVQTNFLHIAS